MINELKLYAQRIDKAKYFLLHLVKWDIKFKFRGSKLGIFWTILQPLLLTLIISAVFGFVFHQEMGEYAPYILSGLLVWDIINAAVVGNSYSFLQAESYIKQYSHPVVIYPMRAAMVSLVTFFIAFSAFFIWICFLYPQNIPVGAITLPLTSMIYFVFSWSLSIISSHLHIRFRDYPYIMNLIMQVLWYFSPVFFREKMFASNELLYMAFKWNPVTQALELIREPFFSGRFPSVLTYIYLFVLMIAVAATANIINKKCEKNVIFYF